MSGKFGAAHNNVVNYVSQLLRELFLFGYSESSPRGEKAVRDQVKKVYVVGLLPCILS